MIVYLKLFFLVQLVESIRSVTFELDGITHSFDEYGDFTDGYDLIRWTKTDSGRTIDVVGKFLLKDGEVELLSKYQGITVSPVIQSMFSSCVHHHRSLDHHHHVLQLPPSKCSESCPPGTSKGVVNVVKSCCYNCTECPEGTYTNKSGISQFMTLLIFAFFTFIYCLLNKCKVLTQVL